jgi:hypothetical protein
VVHLDARSLLHHVHVHIPRGYRVEHPGVQRGASQVPLPYRDEDQGRPRQTLHHTGCP